MPNSPHSNAEPTGLRAHTTAVAALAVGRTIDVRRCEIHRWAYLWALLLSASLSFASEPPNVVLIMTDDQGYGDFGFTGNQQIKTPTFDRLAAESVRFTRFYVSPVCAPTRASLLTGRYHLRTGTWGVAKGRDALHPDEVTIAEALQHAGYRTGMFGKWHNGEHYPSVPHGQGFDEFVGFRGGHINRYFDTPLERNGRPINGTGYISDYLTNEAIRFAQENRGRPFFLYLAYNAPHTPLFLPDRYLQMYKALGLDDYTAAIYGMISNLDDNVARLLAAIEQFGLAENTIVVFLSDNGPNGQRYNAGLRGGKTTVYEGGCRVPLLLRWPGHFPAGTIIDTIAGHIDILPTIIDMCQVSMPATRPLDGRSLLPLIQGPRTNWPDRALFTHAESPSTLRAEPFPGTIRTQHYNLVNGTELYDIRSDTGERKNLALQHPEKVDELRSAYENWFRDVSTDRAFLPKSIPVGFAAEPRVVLSAPHARFKGNLRFFDMGWPYDWVTNWRSVEDEVSWELEIVHQGWYALELYYRCSAVDLGAEIAVQVDGTTMYGTVNASSSPTPSKGSPRELGATNVPLVKWEKMRFGKLKLSPGRKEISVRALKIPGSNAMDLESLAITRLD